MQNNAMLADRDQPTASTRKMRLNTAETSAYLSEVHGLKRAVATLEKLRSIGGGPPFVQFGRSVAYERTAINAWVEQRVSRPKRSTSDVSQPETCP